MFLCYHIYHLSSRILSRFSCDFRHISPLLLWNLPFSSTYIYVILGQKWMICKIDLYASSVRWMGSCHRNEKHVLRYIGRTRCLQYKRISHIVKGYVFRHTFYHNWRYLFLYFFRQIKDNLHVWSKFKEVVFYYGW